MQRLVKNVGESQKKGVSWLNGRFGFGVHSFRAASAGLHIRTRTSEFGTYEISINRDQVTGISPPRPLTDLPFPTSSGTGSSIHLRTFDHDWWKDISLDILVEEIEQHFERLLSRPNLLITVREIAQGVIVREKSCRFYSYIYNSYCVPSIIRPFDYNSVRGVRIQRILKVQASKGHVHEVPVELVVAHTDFATNRPRFFSIGRRIQDVALVPSFLKFSEYKKSLWGHPQLIGYVDVGTVLEPVITRDEFRRSQARTHLFEQLVELEKDIKHALDVELDRQRVLSMGRLEETLETVLGKIALEDHRALKREKRQKKKAIKEGLHASSCLTFCNS